MQGIVKPHFRLKGRIINLRCRSPLRGADRQVYWPLNNSFNQLPFTFDDEGPDAIIRFPKPGGHGDGPESRERGADYGVP